MVTTFSFYQHEIPVRREKSVHRKGRDSIYLVRWLLKRYGSSMGSMRRWWTALERFPQDPVGFRRNNFDAIRLFLAVLVIYSHSFPLSLGDNNQEPLFRITKHNLSFGGVAVAAFFIVSGFLITHSWIRRPMLKEFLRNRVLRIVPGYAACILISALVIVPLFAGVQHTTSGHAGWFPTAWGILTLDKYEPAGVFPHNPFPGEFNGSLWSIHFEFLCYLLVGALGVAGMLRRRFVAVLLFVLLPLFVADRVLYHPIHWPGCLKYYPTYLIGDFGLLIFSTAFFLAGSTFRIYLRHIPRSRWLAGVAVLVAACSLLFPGAPVLAAMFAGTYLILYVAFSRTLQLHNAARFGDFSYGTYLYAFIIQQLLVSVWPGVTPMQLFLAAAPLALLAGAASWFTTERRFLRAKHKTAPATTTAFPA